MITILRKCPACVTWNDQETREEIPFEGSAGFNKLPQAKCANCGHIWHCRITQADRSHQPPPGSINLGSGTLYRDGEKIADVTNMSIEPRPADVRDLVSHPSIIREICEDHPADRIQGSTHCRICGKRINPYIHHDCSPLKL
jgi:hypothetical protein